MANYVINYSGGTITLTSGNANVDTGLTLMGQNYANYGQPMNQNWMSLLENFASNATVPNLVVEGMIWYDAANTQLKLNVGNGTANWRYVVTTANAVGNAAFDTITANVVTANAVSGNGANLTNINASNITSGTLSNARLSGTYAIDTTGTANFANFAGNVTVASQPNITSLGTLTGLTVSGNLSAGNSNVTGNMGVTGNLTVSGTITGNIVGNVSGNIIVPGSNTQVLFNNQGNAGTSANLSFNGTTLIVNGNANATTFNGSGAGLTNVPGANVSGQVPFAAVANSVAGANVSGTVANATYATSAGTATTATTSILTSTVTTASQPNITSVGTLTNLSVSGTITASNIVANTGIFSGNGSGLSSLAGANVTGAVANANYATTSGTALSVAGANVSGTVANANYSAFAGTAFNITAANVVGTVANANYAAFAGTAFSVAGSNVSGQVASANFATYATHVTDATQPNITSVGTLTTLAVSGNTSTNNLSVTNNANIGGNLTVTGTITGNIVGNISGNLVVPGSNTDVLFNDNGQAGASANLRFSGTSLNVIGTVNATSFTGSGSGLTSIPGGNVSGAVAFATTANSVAGSNVSGTVANATHAASAGTAGTVTTAAQPNITSLGTLTGLNVNGTVNATTFSSNVATGTAPFSVQSTTRVANLNADFLDDYSTSVATVANTIVVRDASGNINANTLIVNTIAATSLVNGNSNVSIPAANGNVNISSAGNANIVVVTGTGANITGTANITGNANVGNIGAAAGVFTSNVIAGNVYANAGTVGALLLTGTLTTASQPNVTSLGTLSALEVNGSVNAINFTANTGVFTGNGSGLTNINASSITSGTLAQARLANSSFTINGTSVSLGGSATITAQSPSALTLGSYLTGGSFNGSSAVTANVDATDAATANKVVARDANGSFSANVVTASSFSGNGSSITGINASSITSGTLAQARLANSSLTVNGTSISLGGSGTVTANTTQTLTRGTYLTGSDFNGGTATTWAVDATDAATANKIVARDANGSFSGNVITATSFIGNVQGNIGGILANGSSNVSIPAANGNVNISSGGNANVFVVTATGANLTGVLNVTGNANAGNIGASAGVFTTVSGNGRALTNLSASNIDTGTLAQARLANASVTLGSTALTLGSTVTTVAGLSSLTSTTLTGTLTTAAQPNVTSLGTLTDLNVSGNAVIGGNLTVNGNIAYVNVETLAVEDPIIQLQTGPNGAAPSSNSGKDIGTALNYYDTQARVAFMGWDVSNAEFAFGSQVSITNEVVTITALGNIRAGNFVGTFIGVADSANTVINASQPNITSLGTLTSLAVNGNITAANITANTGVFTGNGSGLTNLNASNITTGTLAQSRLANSSLTVNGTAISLGGSGTVTANTSQSHSNGAYITGGSFNGGTAITWAVDATDAATASKVVARDANGSFSANIITANSFSGNVTGNGANLTNLNASNISSGTLAQARLANSSLTVNGTSISLGGSGTVTANTGSVLTFSNGGTGDASGTTFNGGTARTISYNSVGAPSTTGTNASGTWGISITGTAPTVTTNAQPNITSIGTLTSLNSSGNITAPSLIANTGYIVGSVQTGISANGSTLATATAISRQYNVVSTVTAGQGVVLPSATAGMRLTVINTAAANLNIYPASSAQINSLGANLAFVLGGNTNAIDLVAVSGTQWYTINAVYA